MKETQVTTPKEFLDRINARDFQALYRCRWSPEAARETVATLATLLADPDARIVAEALRALARIGPNALPALSAISGVSAHADRIVRSLMVSTLASVCLERPSEAIPSLIQAAEQADLLESALFALINFGPAAAPAAALFRRTYASRTAKLRRLAIRGLFACGATDAETLAVLVKAKTDASAEVRKLASRERALS
jgi:HEAT repeat protein